MPLTPPLYEKFLGAWALIPESCQYEQGPPPQRGSYIIQESGEGLQFSIAWRDARGLDHELSFFGIPDGRVVPFPGTELADALSVTAVSRTELNSSAFLNGQEISIAQRQLDATGAAMRITQLVRVPVPLANVAIYARARQ